MHDIAARTAPNSCRFKSPLNITLSIVARNNVDLYPSSTRSRKHICILQGRAWQYLRKYKVVSRSQSLSLNIPKRLSLARNAVRQDPETWFWKRWYLLLRKIKNSRPFLHYLEAETSLPPIAKCYRVETFTLDFLDVARAQVNLVVTVD